MPALRDLETHLATLGRSLLGYSGGVDSALLAVAATRALGPGRFLAVIGRSASYPEVQYRAAMEIAASFAVPLLEVETRELDDPRYAANPTNRCYFCKAELWRRLDALARERGFETVLDGTNASDLGEHRPGLRAATEFRVRSPLAELGWSKDMIRCAARELGIPVWNAPAAPCLSSRIQYGLAVTPERLRQVESGEAFLRDLGVIGDLRVRHHGDRVRIETEPSQFGLLESAWPRVTAFFSHLGVARIAIDPRGYRRGGMLQVLPITV